MNHLKPTTTHLSTAQKIGQQADHWSMTYQWTAQKTGQQSGHQAAHALHVHKYNHHLADNNLFPET
jgi:hypothetical protein